MRFLLLLMMSLTAAPLAADPAARLASAAESPLIDRWLFGPESPLDVVIDLGFSYGEGNALTAQAIATAVAHGHAGARARAMADLLQADLDDDLVVTRDEIDLIDLDLSGFQRGLLWTRHRHADANRDGRVEFTELRVYALLRADKYLSPGRKDMLEALLLLDLDGDGGVTVEEAEEALEALAKRPTLEAASAEEEA